MLSLYLVVSHCFSPFYFSIKVFDFGLSKEVHESMAVLGDGTYKLTGYTGSLRYVPPDAKYRS